MPHFDDLQDKNKMIEKEERGMPILWSSKFVRENTSSWK